VDLGCDAGPVLAPELAAVLAEVERGAESQDQLAAASGLAPGEVAVAVARLELLGYLCCGATGRLERTPLSAPSPPAE
jgi:hypothetical protein